jgi:hypothetical protein
MGQVTEFIALPIIQRIMWEILYVLKDEADFSKPIFIYNSYPVPYNMEEWKVTMAHIIWGQRTELRCVPGELRGGWSFISHGWAEAHLSFK